MANDADVTSLIDVPKREHLFILYLDKDRNYDTNRLKAVFTIRLWSKGATDKLSHDIVRDTENAQLPISINA